MTGAGGDGRRPSPRGDRSAATEAGVGGGTPAAGARGGVPGTLGALGFYLAAAVLLTLPLPGAVGETVARAVRPDTWLNVWALAWTSEHLVAAPSELFDANIFYPRRHTLAYTDHFIGQALVAAPVYWITDSAALAYNVAWYAALVLTGWAGFLWTRRLLGGGPAATAGALVAGAVCMLTPGRRTALGHLQILSLQGVPLALLAVHGLAARPTALRVLLLAAATVYAALCSWYTAAYVALLLPLVGLAACVVVGRREGRRAARRLALAGTAALVLAAAVLAPVAAPYRAVQEELAFARPARELVDTSLRPVDWAASWSWLHEGRLPAGSGAGGHFPGVTVALLALSGLVVAWRRRSPWPWVYAGLAVAFAVLSLGPRWPGGAGGGIALPYALLYEHLPGFSALRNPYRAAFIATLLLAAPVAVGARAWIEGATATRRRPALAVGLGVCLAAAHWMEAWPGPQQVEPLPAAPSGAHRWLAARGGATLEWPLPRPPDGNARYQLWTVGTWALLANGHSGLYPPELMALYDVDDEFPDAGFLAAVKERYPVDWLLAHHGRAADPASSRRQAAAAADLTAVWSAGDDVVYRIDRGAPAGWLRRVVRAVDLDAGVSVRVAGTAAGCGLRARLDGAAVAVEERGGRAWVEPGAGELDDYLVELELWRVADPGVAAPGEGGPVRPAIADALDGLPVRVEAAAAASPGAGAPAGPASAVAEVRINGWPVVRGAVVLARLAAADGTLLATRSAPANLAAATAAVNDFLAAARSGDVVVAAVADATGAGLAARLPLLLDGAGASVPDASRPLSGTGGAWALAGVAGAAPGSGREAAGEGSVASVAGPPAACLVEPLRDLRTETAPGG